MTTLFSTSKWASSPLAYWTIQYEYKRSGADMYYRFYWKVWLNSSASWYYDAMRIQLYLNGVQHNVTVKAHNDNEKGWSYEGTTDWYKVANKTSGTVPFYAKLYDIDSKTTKATSKTYALSVSGVASAIGSIASFDVDNGVTIPITKYDTSYTDTLVVSYGGTTIKTVDGITNGTKVSFADELTTIYNLMKNVKSGTFTFTLTTKSGSTTLGTSTKTATGSITNANPTFASTQVDYADTNQSSINVTGNAKHIVQNKSVLGVTFGAASGNKGATISQYTIEVNGVIKTATKSGSVNFGTIDSSQDVTLKVTAKDSRGNTTTVQKTVKVLAWSLPTFTATLERLNNYEDTTFLTVQATISPVNGINTKTITYNTKKSGGTYGTATTIEDGVTNTVECDKNYAHVFSITVADRFGSTTKEYSIEKGKFPLFIDTEKNAVGINEFPQSGEALRVAGGKAVFEDSIHIEGKLVADFIVSQGITDGWTWRKWNSGIAECWAILQYNAHASYEVTNSNYFHYEEVELPFAFAEPPCSTFAGRAGSGVAYPVRVQNTVDTVRWYLVTNQDNVDITIHFQVIGRWK